jgi:hypothetical protein
MASPSAPRRFTRDDLLPALLALTAIGMGVVIFGFFLFPATQVGFDEGFEAAGVERVIDGKGLPYVDFAAIRGPFLYWTQAIITLVTGRFQWTGTRVMALGACAITGASAFLAGWAAGWPLAGAIAAALNVFVLATYYPPGPGVGIHGEPVAVAYIAAAFFIVSYALYRARTPRRRVVLLALGGATLAAGVLTKQTMALAVAPMLLWVAAHGGTRVAAAELDTRARARALIRGWALPFLGGGAGLLAAVLLRYAAAGQLGTFIFWSSGVTSKIYMSPYQGRVAQLVVEWFMGEPWAIMGAVLAGTVALGAVAGRATSMRPRGLLAGVGASAFELAVGLMALVVLLAAAIPHRIWGHYFVPIYPFFGLALGMLLERFAVRGAASPRAAQAVVALLVGGLLVGAGVNRLATLRRERAAGGWASPRPNPVCAEIERIAGPGREAIFIWGTAGDLYITCRRRSSSMHTNTMLVVGIVPPDWTPHDDRVPAGSRETILAELTAKPPKVIIDHTISSAGSAMMDIPALASFVNERYCRDSVIQDRGKALTLFARKDTAACQNRSP